jgi:hypothetical protein
MATKVYCDRCGATEAFSVRINIGSSQTAGKIVQPPKFDGDLCASCFSNVSKIMCSAMEPMQLKA